MHTYCPPIWWTIVSFILEVKFVNFFYPFLFSFFFKDNDNWISWNVKLNVFLFSLQLIFIFYRKKREDVDGCCCCWFFVLNNTIIAILGEWLILCRDRWLRWDRTNPILRRKWGSKSYRRIDVVVALYLGHQHHQQYQWQNRQQDQRSLQLTQHPSG